MLVEMIRRIEQQFEVSYRFPVLFTGGVFDPKNPVLYETLRAADPERRHRVMAFLDENVVNARPGLPQEIRAYLDAHGDALELQGKPVTVPGGEQVKQSFSTLENLLTTMLNTRLDRHAFILAAGGGAMLDAVGLAASLVHRGLRMVRIPTTVLAQNDAGVGVKTGIDFGGGKNAIGTFAPPYAVFNDPEFLLTLPRREWLAGIPEAFKVAIIRNAEFFEWLEVNAEKLTETVATDESSRGGLEARRETRALEGMKELVYRCANEHIEHMRSGGDPFETGSARPLDYGHWSAHKLERMSGFAIGHGEAVAVGIVLDACYAVSQGLLNEQEFLRIYQGLRRAGLPLWFGELDRRGANGTREVYDGLIEFREHLGGDLCITLPNGIGQRVEVDQIDLTVMDAAIERLREMNSARCVL